MREMVEKKDKDKHEHKEEIIYISPNEILYDGTILYGGITKENIEGCLDGASIVNYRLPTPGGHSAGVLLLFYNKQSFCPSCKTSIKNRPILLMDNKEFTYPCLFCGVWVWWPIGERKIEARFQ
jgi:hypothetical protein